jgi:FtsP/CotA-like multicopper oxidase with cupredoxin domain
MCRKTTSVRSTRRRLFRRGERVRLRFIIGSSMSIFDVRIPGLNLTVVAADGQDVDPVSVDEFRIATAEVYDVIVEPKDDPAYTIFAQSSTDRAMRAARWRPNRACKRRCRRSILDRSSP